MARIVVLGVPHHVAQRGNNRQEISFDEQGGRLYLSLPKEYVGQFGQFIPCYRLLGNHMHLVVVPRSPLSLAQAIGRTDCRYP